jgi:Zn-dependent peptidase ImmA (M78 family)
MDKLGNLVFPTQDLSAARAAVIREARSLIEETYRCFPSWCPPPFDPNLYASVMHIPVHYEPTPGEWDALYVPFPSKERIIINDNVRSPGRRRFSLAHEIVHAWFDDSSGERYFLRTQNRKKYEGDEYSRALEKCCDWGAAELLMPQPWFGETFAKLGLRASSVPELARLFEVSLEAAAFRMLETSGTSCAIGFFDFAISAAEAKRPVQSDQSLGFPTYRIRRLFKTGDFPFLFPSGKSVPKSSVVYQCSLGHEEINSVEQYQLGPLTARLCVSAFPLHRERRITYPPVVCAVFVQDKAVTTSTT